MPSGVAVKEWQGKCTREELRPIPISGFEELEIWKTLQVVFRDMDAVPDSN
jgi:hypothetical protein